MDLERSQGLNCQQSFLVSRDDIFLNEAATLRLRFYNEGQRPELVAKLRELIWNYYAQARRSFLWRESVTPYNVVVSEVMLQQTSTIRVEQKFQDFIQQFSSFEALATASFEDVLRYWKGLGYNRRAKNLQTIAQKIVADHGGNLPANPSIIQTFPGIGAATASSICAFAFDAPSIFFETNIRTVLIYFFIHEDRVVHDKELLPFATALFDLSRPRDWYYALMDVGVLIKKRVGNLTQMSKHYTKQSKFEGSRRQIRGKVLELLLATPHLTQKEIEIRIADGAARTQGVIDELLSENFLVIHDGQISLRK